MDDTLTMLRQRLAEAEDDAARIRQAIAIIEEPDGPRTAHGAARASNGGRKVVSLAKILKTIRNEPGLTTTRLAKQLDGDQAQVLVLLKAQEQAGTVRREGARRATRWFTVGGNS